MGGVQSVSGVAVGEAGSAQVAGVGRPAGARSAGAPSAVAGPVATGRDANGTSASRAGAAAGLPSLMLRWIEAVALLGPSVRDK